MAVRWLSQIENFTPDGTPVHDPRGFHRQMLRILHNPLLPCELEAREKILLEPRARSGIYYWYFPASEFWEVEWYFRSVCRAIEGTWNKSRSRGGGGAFSLVPRRVSDESGNLYSAATCSQLHTEIFVALIPSARVYLAAEVANSRIACLIDREIKIRGNIYLPKSVCIKKKSILGTSYDRGKFDSVDGGKGIFSRGSARMKQVVRRVGLYMWPDFVRRGKVRGYVAGWSSYQGCESRGRQSDVLVSYPACLNQRAEKKRTCQSNSHG